MRNQEEQKLKKEVLKERSEKLVKLEKELEKLKLKRVWLDDFSGYWFEGNFKGKFFNYKLIAEPDFSFISLQTEIYSEGMIYSDKKQFEDIYRYRGKVTVDKVKRVLKMIK